MPKPPRASTLAKHISLDDLPATLQNRAGLILGPALTHSTTSFPDLSARLAERFHVPNGASFLHTADNVLDSGVPESDLIAIISGFFAPPTHHWPASGVAIPKWEAVLSVAVDMVFENALSEAEARRPVSRHVTVATDFRQPLPPRSLPVLKLLGSVRSADCVHSTASYLRRRAQWPEAVRDILRPTPRRPRSNPRPHRSPVVSL